MPGKEYGPAWFVSPWNFDSGAPENLRMRFHDTTLRDGEQMAGVVFSKEQKFEIAELLDAAGVDRIEAGMVAVSPEDREAIRMIVDADLEAEVWTICRAIPKDVDFAVEAGVDGVGIILMANEQYRKIFRWDLDEVLDKAVDATQRAVDNGFKTTLLIVDSTRMAPDLLRRIVGEVAERAGVGAVSLMDTFGGLSPLGSERIIKAVTSWTDLPVEFHPHNDFGVATANAIAAVRAGASIVHTCVLGLGERIGNVAFEEVAVTSKLLYGMEHGIDLAKIEELARVVQESSGVRAAINKPIIGSAFNRIESGAVAAEWIRWTRKMGGEPQWLFPFLPELVGKQGVEIVLGKGSGVANVEARLEEMDVSFDETLARSLLEKVKERSVELGHDLDQAEFRRLIDGAKAS